MRNPFRRKKTRRKTFAERVQEAREKEAQKEELKAILNDFAQNLPGPPIKLIHTPKKVVKQRTEELVEETTEKLLKLL